MTITVPDDVLRATQMTEDDIRQELAIALFARDKLTLGQASHLAGLSQREFRHLLAAREITVHYDVEDLEEDILTLKKREQE